MFVNRIISICGEIIKFSWFSLSFYAARTEKHKKKNMFEARLTSSAVLKKVLDAIKDLLNEATFDCSDSGIQVICD